MNIANTSLNNNITATSNPHSAVNELRKQKNELMQQLQKVNGSAEDGKTKAEKIKAINDKIADINQQIQKAQMEEQQKKLEEAQEKNTENAEKQKSRYAQDNQTEGVELSKSLNSLLEVKNINSTIITMNTVQAKLSSQSAVAEEEIKHSKGSVVYQQRIVDKNEDKINQIEQNIAKKMQAANKKMMKSAQQGTEEVAKPSASRQKQGVGQESEISDSKSDSQNGGQVESANTTAEKSKYINLLA